MTTHSTERINPLKRRVRSISALAMAAVLLAQPATAQNSGSQGGRLMSVDDLRGLDCTTFEGAAGVLDYNVDAYNLLEFVCVAGEDGNDDPGQGGGKPGGGGIAQELCDSGILLNEGDALAAAAAIELCSGAQNAPLLNAHHVRADGTPWAYTAQGGITDAFGLNVTPRAGSRLLVLSSGRARDASDPDACNSASCSGEGAGTAPSGFPQTVPGCSTAETIYDDVALEVTLRAPSKARGFAFDFNFYSFEYPEWVCTEFNDQFVVLMDPPPQDSINGNVAFDSQYNPVSVNLAYFDVCAGCAQGETDLIGTGFDLWDDAGATGWLTTTVPVEGGTEFTLRFVIWDTGDQDFDSTVLIDNFRWLTDSTTIDTRPSD